MNARAKTWWGLGCGAVFAFATGGLGCAAPVATDERADAVEGPSDDEGAGPEGDALPEERMERLRFERAPDAAPPGSAADEAGCGEGRGAPETEAGATEGEASLSAGACYYTSGGMFGGQLVCNTLWSKLAAYCGIDGVASYGSCHCSCNSITNWCTCNTHVCCN